MADYRLYEDNIGMYGGRYYPGLGAPAGKERAGGRVQVPEVPVTKEVEAELRRTLRGMTERAVENICRRFRKLIGSAAAKAYELHVQKKMPKPKAVGVAVRAVLAVAYRPQYKALWSADR